VNHLTIAFQGTYGAFGEEAVRRGWRDGEARPMATFEDVVRSVDAGISDHGVLPVWNTVLGTIPFAQAALAEGTRIEVTGEIEVPIRLALLARRGSRLETIHYVGSHPAALGQCARFLAAHPALTPCPTWDTAGAAREIGDDPGPRPWFALLPGASPTTVGAIASEESAERYDLVVLRSAIQDVAENVTRFAILTRAGGVR
jgi:prephenate dehydratase